VVPPTLASDDSSCGFDRVTSALIITETDADLFQPAPDILATSGDYKLLRLHRGPEPSAADVSFHSSTVEDL
jgi:hypothetical protein